jgi:uncharacterized protein (TIGR03790 family)
MLKLFRNGMVSLVLLARSLSLADGTEVVVIYNSSLPESRAVAEHYARARAVPADQIFGFALPETETITRAVFRERLQQPLAKKLESQKLWQFGRGDLPGTNGTTYRTSRKVIGSKIRYAVLCYGVPLKISSDSTLREAAAETMRPEIRRNEAAVDSELACLPLLKAGYTVTGFHPNPLFGTTNAAALHPTNGLLLVARLDGPTPAVARRLVDQAVAVETNGLWGRAYFDTRNVADPNYKVGDEWIETAAKIARQLGYDVELDRGGDTFPAGFPMSQIAIYQGWYREHVGGPLAAPEVEFMPGAFAYHLHSFSANSLRTTTNHWVGPLLAKGATCTMGSVFEPYLTGTPDLAMFTSRWLQLGFTFGEAAAAAQSLVSWQTTVIGDPLYRPFGRPLPEQHLALLAQTNRLAEWSLARVANVSRDRGVGVIEMTTALEETPLTKTSAVLTEKLAELYDALGKPASALATWNRALSLNPTPQQRLRLRLILAEKSTAAGRKPEAQAQYQSLLDENPNYAAASSIRQKLAALAPPPANPSVTNQVR